MAGLVGGVAAVIVGYPALRRRGLTLAVSTLAFGLFVSSFLLNRTIPFLRDRLPGRRIDRGTLLGIELDERDRDVLRLPGRAGAGLIMVVGLRRSRTGRVLIAIRENEKAARAYGVNATRTSLAAFALSGFLAAVAGALYVHQQTASAPSRTCRSQPRAVHDGGDRRARLAAGRPARRHLRPQRSTSSCPSSGSSSPPASGLLLVLLVFPSGFGGVLADLRDGALRKVATRRGIVVPSLLADVRVEEVADQPPEETVLAEAAEIAEQRPRPRPTRDAARRTTRARGHPDPGARRPPTTRRPQRPPAAHHRPGPRCRRRHGRGGAVVTRQDETVGRGRPRRPMRAEARGVADALPPLPLDAIDGGGAGEDAAAIVRRRRQGPAATADGGAAHGGPWARWKQRTTQGAPCYPLGVLFGLNMVDELDRTAFGVLLPEIRDHFGLDNNGILTVVSLSLIAALILALPIGFYGDRWRRVPIAGRRRRRVGRVLGAHRRGQQPVDARGRPPGAGLGRAVNDPVHNSLLADYYDIPARPRVYAVHRYANALGQFLGPLLGGLIAYAFGWRAPFIVFAVVTGVFVVLTFRLREPIRGHFERKAMGEATRWPPPRRTRRRGPSRSASCGRSGRCAASSSPCRSSPSPSSAC